jgi:hypothetical protein
MVAHPWAIRCYGEYLNIGPQSLRLTQCAQTVVARSPLPEQDRAATLSAVFQYVYGFTSTESRWLEYGRKAGRTADEFVAEAASPLFPGVHVRGGLLERHATQTMEELRDQDFDRALDLLIAGMVAGADA